MSCIWPFMPPSGWGRTIWRSSPQNTTVLPGSLATAAFSLAYAIFEQFPPLWPQLADMPLVACIIGAVFVGIGAGLTVRIGGASSGDDALAMSLSHLTRIEIQWIYLITDLVVLGLSLTYIPLERIVFSLITVVLSGQIIGFIQKMPLPGSKR